MYAGVFVAVVTPFLDDGSINLEMLSRHLEWLIDQGVHGLMMTGTAGEFPNLSDQERLDVAQRAADTVAGRVPVIFHTGHMNREAMLALTQQADKLGVDAVMVIPPLIVRATQDEMETYFREVADATSLDVVIYNNPGRVAVSLKAETLIRLSEVSGIAVLKDSGRSMNETAQIIEEAGPDLIVLSGEADLFLPTLALGGAGGILTMPNIVPKMHVELFDAFQSGDLERARMLNSALAGLSKVLSAEGKYHAAIKAAMRALDMPVGFPRRPLTDVSEDTNVMIRRQLELLEAFPV